VDQRAADPELWQDGDAALRIQQERAQIGRTLDAFDAIDKAVADAWELRDMAALDGDIEAEVVASLDEVVSRLNAFELQRLLGGPYDAMGAIVSVNAGAGGTESQDWAQILLRMLTRWAERKGFNLQMLDVQAGEEAGIKSASFLVDGPYAYGYLKNEVGVHRLVRISPFDAQKRRHTSFASVAVAPDIDDTIEIEIRDEDVRVDTYRASGAGGQHVNKTDSAVRLTHAPSGVVVACQAERSQHKNRAKAYKMLRAKLFALALQEREEAASKLAGVKKKIEWGSQFRSYVLQPYRMIKDHRTGHETSQVDSVLDGELDGFIEAALNGQTPSGQADAAQDDL
jgi:peptide chain release factor 2